MASLIYGNKLPLLQKGFRTKINDSEIVGKTLEGADASFGDVLYVGSAEGLVSKTGTVFAGILCGTNVKMPSVYPAGQGVDIATKADEALNCLVRGSIAVACADDVAAGDKAYVNAGVITKTSTGGIEIGVFTGIKEGGLVEVFIRR